MTSTESQRQADFTITVYRPPGVDFLKRKKFCVSLWMKSGSRSSAFVWFTCVTSVKSVVINVIVYPGSHWISNIACSTIKAPWLFCSFFDTDISLQLLPVDKADMRYFILKITHADIEFAPSLSWLTLKMPFNMWPLATRKIFAANNHTEIIQGHS